MKRLTFLLIFSAIPFWGAEAVYKLSYDINMSPYAGGEDLLFGTRVVERGSIYLDQKTGAHLSRSLPARAWRAVELSLIYFPLNFFTSIVQHEVFGHGYRIRDINRNAISVNGYQFDFPPPYGSGNAETRFSFIPSRIFLPELTTISIAGIEAQSILAFQTSFKWLSLKRIDPRQVALYLVSRYALNIYGTDDSLNSNENDLTSYTQTLNHTYSDGSLSVSHLKTLGLINLIDPFTYLSTYAWFKYVFSGKEMKLPIRYIPSVRLGLTPFGPEYFLDQYLLKNRPIYFYVKGARHAKNTSFGGGLFAPTLFQKKGWSLGMRFDFWNQPKLLLQEGRFSLRRLDLRERANKKNPLYSFHDQHTMRYGCGGSFIGSYQKNRALGFEIEIGGKTAGFLPGYSLYASPVVRISYLASF